MLGDEISPSTVVYRTENSRTTLQQLIDTVASNQNQDEGARSLSDDGPSALKQSKVSPPPSDTESSDGKVGDTLAEGGDGDNAPKASKLTWIQGVFIPCLLNIWGVIMFLRLGYVVGQAGILLACLIVFISKVVTTLTALSLCAICTNGEVKGGGVYFLISRALGPIYGGTIGVLFFLAQAVATSLYVIGFAESLSELLVDAGVPYMTGSELNDVRILGLLTSIILLMVAMIGVSWYAKCQVGLLVTLLVSMFSVVIGGFFPGIPSESENEQAGFVGYALRNLDPNFVTDPDNTRVEQTFFTVFAVFFPAATGVMAGANLSGDLKDPSSAIPKGTLGAIAVTFVSYIILVWVVGSANLACSDADGEEFCMNFETAAQTGNVPEGGLIFNKLIMGNMSIWSPLFYVGVFAATLSSALASLVGAPRILQSVAGDKVFPWPWFNYFGKGHGVNNEPIRAYVLTFLICCGCVSIGSLDVIAPLISNFFMVSYAFTNYACFASSYARYPGWRPSFQYYNKWLSLFGFFLCIAVMFLMDWLTAILTVILAAMLYVYLLWLDPAVNWGAAGEARRYLRTLKGMEELQSLTREHVKTYRPQFLVMCGKPEERPGLVRFVSLLSKGGGIMLCGDVVTKSELQEFINYEEEEVIHETTRMLGDIAEEEDDEAKELDVETPQEDKLAHLELASILSQRLAAVIERRASGEEYLANKQRWGGRRCPGAFIDSVVGDSLLDGFQSLLQCSGVGRMRPNTVVLGFKTHWASEPRVKVREYEQMIRITLASNLGIMIVRDEAGVFNIESSPPREGPARKLVRHMSSNISANFTESTPDLENGAVPSFPRNNPDRSIEGDTIDVWWVSDDGGLTMLIPHLLKQNRMMRKCQKLRVLTVTNYNHEETSKLQKTEFRMVHLLKKFRIQASVEAVEANLADRAREDIRAQFERVSHVKMADLTEQERLKTNQILRMAELMRERSRGPNTSMVFVTLPIPETGIAVGLYTAWLHMLSVNMPPTIMMRGNNENVLTFIC